jgi:hypothetical protein
LLFLALDPGKTNDALIGVDYEDHDTIFRISQENSHIRTGAPRISQPGSEA